MRTLTTSFTSTSSQVSSAYSMHAASRSRQALEAVDAYLGRDGAYAAPRTAGSRLGLFLDNLVEKLLK
jgi:hypothetical protein